MTNKQFKESCDKSILDLIESIRTDDEKLTQTAKIKFEYVAEEYCHYDWDKNWSRLMRYCSDLIRPSEPSTKTEHLHQKGMFLLYESLRELILGNYRTVKEETTFEQTLIRIIKRTHYDNLGVTCYPSSRKLRLVEGAPNEGEISLDSIPNDPEEDRVEAYERQLEYLNRFMAFVKRRSENSLAYEILKVSLEESDPKKTLKSNQKLAIILGVPIERVVSGKRMMKRLQKEWVTRNDASGNDTTRGDRNGH